MAGDDDRDRVPTDRPTYRPGGPCSTDGEGDLAVARDLAPRDIADGREDVPVPRRPHREIERYIEGPALAREVLLELTDRAFEEGAKSGCEPRATRCRDGAVHSSAELFEKYRLRREQLDGHHTRRGDRHVDRPPWGLDPTADDDRAHEDSLPDYAHREDDRLHQHSGVTTEGGTPEPAPAADAPAGVPRLADADRPFMRRTFAALHHRDFRIYFLGQLISVTGTWMQQVAQGWLILVLTGSPFLLGVVTAARALPVLVLAFPAGVAADRFDKRTIIFASTVVSFVAMTILAYLTVTDQIDVGGVIVIALVLGTASAVELPARSSFVVELAGPRHLAHAIALNSLTFNGARVLGPAVAGFIVAAFGPGVAFALNAASFIPVLISLVVIRPAILERTTTRARGALGETVAYLRSEPRVAGLLALLAANTTFASGYIYLGPTLARDLGQGAEGFGLLLSVTGIGAVAAGLRLAATSGRDRRAPVLIASAGIVTAALIGVALSGSFIVTVFLFVAIGWGMLSFNATSNTIIQTIVPNVLRGRIMSIYVIVMLGILPGGSLLIGALADHFGTAVALGLGGLAWGATVSVAFGLSASLRGV